MKRALVLGLGLSNKPLDHKALEGVIDFKAELDRQRHDGGDGTYVDLEFAKGGTTGWRPDHGNLGSE